MIYKILYGSINSEGQWWDGDQWRNSAKPEDPQHEKVYEFLRLVQYANDVHEKSTHANGVFKCPRCWQRHYLCDTFDFLCDCCVEVVYDHPTTLASTRNSIDIWKFKIKADPDIKNRMNLRQDLENLKQLPDQFTYNGELYNVVQVIMENRGDVLLRPVSSDLLEPKDKKKFDITVNYKELLHLLKN